MERSRSLVGMEVPITGSDSVKWIESAIVSAGGCCTKILLSKADENPGDNGILVTSSESTPVKLRRSMLLAPKRIHKSQPCALDLVELCAHKEFPRTGIRILFPDALCPFAFICKDEFNLQTHPHYGEITAVAATSGSLVIGRSDGSVSLFQLGMFDQSAPDFVHELRDDAGIGRLWGFISRAIVKSSSIRLVTLNNGTFFKDSSAAKISALVSMRNNALFGKWLWRFPRERSGLWHKVIASIYGTHPNGWDANMVVRWSHRRPWKAIAQVFQRLMSSLSSVLFSPSMVDSRAWSLSLSGLFSVKFFFLALSKVSNPILFLPAKFLWSSKAPSKVKALAWLVAHGKVNTNDKLQLRRPYKSLCPQWCILCKGSGGSIDHLFLHCPVTIGLWHKLFNLAGLVWVPPRSVEDMMVITFKGLGNSLRGKTLWQIACLTLIWLVWQERNNMIFEDKGRTEDMLWDLIQFYYSLWASCTEAFRGVPLSVLQLNWIAVYASKV
ncbi:hypothetical protein CK203_027962 [Vitis vinifera]|uniref:Reverse transcriptase zinc-binding domain-containing protein n=1 Tax=Vitis vinifera TaxID=29760 RepID=A0A438J3C4_VITVI|nr:hypothetical protein CK203_027962 [Vitis vinifera]